MTLQDIAAVVGGTLADVTDPAAAVVSDVTADSRTVVSGGAFVALEGERVDGHDFARAAVADGAVVVLASRPVGVPAIIVKDVLVALGRWAKELLRRLPDVRVVGVTGSAGKTTCKDLIAALLAPDFATIAPPGSLNNELGLPLTVLRANESTQWLVLEMGAREIGHVAYLCEIAPPSVAVELLVGFAHIGVFGSRDAIAQAKVELVQALPPDGLAVLNCDDERVLNMQQSSPAPTLLFGLSDRAEIAATEVSLGAGGCARFTLTVPNEPPSDVAMRLVGIHHVTNALAAAAVAHHAGVPANIISTRLSSAHAASRWRMEVRQRADGATVINDAYNASPEAMVAALESLVDIGRFGRTWAVLGEMRELGELSAVEHAKIGALCVDGGVDHLVVVGRGARPIYDEALRVAENSGRSLVLDYVDSAQAAAALVESSLQPTDVVLVKASRAIGLERVAEELIEGVAT